MTQEEKDKLFETLNQMIEHSDKAIAIWNSLMEQSKYPTEVCLKHINLSNQKKRSLS